MFIYSVRASTVRVIGLMLLVAVLIGVVVLSGEGATVSAASDAVTVDYSGVKSAEDRLEFMRGFGIEADAASEVAEEFRMPENFDRVIAGYNELQKKQGLDLLKYKNKRVTRYTYKVTNYKCDGEVYANLFIYRGKVVACDLTNADTGGFVIPMTLVSRDSLK